MKLKIKEENNKKNIINISNSFVRAKKSSSISINGYRILSLALNNATKGQQKINNINIPIYKSHISPNELKFYFKTQSNYSSKYLKDGFDNILTSYIKDSNEEKYYPIFASINYDKRELIFNPLIFNDEKIDLGQINNFSRIILPRLEEGFIRAKKLSKNAFSLELLLQRKIWSEYLWT